MTPPPLPPEVNARIVRPHRGRTIVILGVLGFVFAPFGFVAMFLGKRDLRDMQAGTMDRSGEALTKLGRMLAFVSAIIWTIKWIIVTIIGLIVYFNWAYFSTWF